LALYSHPEVSMPVTTSPTTKFINANAGQALPNLCSPLRTSWPVPGRFSECSRQHGSSGFSIWLSNRSPRPLLHIAIEVAKEGNRHG